jgi:hypothetical protein
MGNNPSAPLITRDANPSAPLQSKGAILQTEMTTEITNKMKSALDVLSKSETIAANELANIRDATSDIRGIFEKVLPMLSTRNPSSSAARAQVGGARRYKRINKTRRRRRRQ